MSTAPTSRPSNHTTEPPTTHSGSRNHTTEPPTTSEQSTSAARTPSVEQEKESVMLQLRDLDVRKVLYLKLNGFHLPWYRYRPPHFLPCVIKIRTEQMLVSSYSVVLVLHCPQLATNNAMFIVSASL